MSKSCKCGCENSKVEPISPHFENMLENCFCSMAKAKEEGMPIVGIMCEFTPREIIMAAGGIPVCLCGGSEEMSASAEKHLPSNLCPLIKSTYGFHSEKENPFLEEAALIVAETTCDGKKKMFELMAETRPMYVLELPQKHGDNDGLAHWQAELGKFKTFLEKRFKTSITKKKLNHAISAMNEERRLRLSLAELMKEDNPPLSGRELLDIKSLMAALPGDIAEYKRLLGSLRSRKPVRRGSVRVLMTGVPMAHGAEQVMELVESQGGTVVALESCSGLKPVLNTVPEKQNDPMKALARHYFENIPCPVITPNTNRFDSLRKLASDFRADCVIELVWHACTTYDVE
ncbi:MAG: hypothetical protein A2X49_13845, partial [Lentisphaerae bacterium GWF2_52_8]